FGRLPYLLKILDVKDMLSIQVHPSKHAAEKGFARENEAGIPLNDPKRNYKDDNHKPELMAALSDFWLLHGFKSQDQLLEVLHSVPELYSLIPLFDEGGYEGLYSAIMRYPQETVNKILQPLLDRIIPLYNEGQLDRTQEDFWAARAALTYNSNGNIDRGIFSIYLLNLVGLKKGEAIFQDAGILHAYLEGQNVEIMANSDNVLRGGLTPKNIDIDELMKHVRFEPIDPWIISDTENGAERIYKTPVDDFELSSFELTTGQTAAFKTATADIMILISGNAVLESGGSKLELRAGESAVMFAGQAVSIRALTDMEAFRASVPVHTV
ncbi:MAG TPA: mannose-6-phosphate isomerase, class I, partial [Chitinophagaceae bacterium]|nr:mannose-6-phosphate isomerase, class I [Chitinophagaceae bacterium]